MEVEIDGAAIYRQEAEIGLLSLLNGPRFSGTTYPFALNSIWNLASAVDTSGQDNK